MSVLKNIPKSTTINGVTLILGDFFEYVKDYPDKHFDSCISSFPYINEEWDCASNTEYYLKHREAFELIRQKCHDYALLFNSSTRQIDLIRQYDSIFRALHWNKERDQRPYKYEPVLVYQLDYPRFSFNHSCFTDAYPCKTIDEEKKLHPYAIPKNVFEVWLLNILTFRDGLKYTRRILEPCAGLFNLGIACLNLGLECVGFEIEPKYYEIAKQRMKDWTPTPENIKTVRRIESAKAQMKLV